MEREDVPDNNSGGAKKAGSRLVSFKLSSLLTAFFLGLAAVSLAYIGGVMSGRHFSSETSRARNVSVTAAESAQPPEETEERKILAPEELEFAHVLRGDGARLKARNKNDVAENVQATTPEKMPEPKPLEAVITPLGDDAAIQDYVFQVGAFRDESGADNLRQLLEGHDLRTRLERDGKHYIVLIALRGNEARAREVVELLRSLKLGDPIVRSRKAVPR